MAAYIGTIDASGNPVWPEKTISGQSYRVPATTLNVPGGFVVLDMNLPPGFDLQAALDALHPAKSAPTGRKATNESQGTQ